MVGSNMCDKLCRIMVGSLACLALTVGIIWLAAGARPQVGAMVPEDVAATLRGGQASCDCEWQVPYFCTAGPNPDPVGDDCSAKSVFTPDPAGSMYENCTTDYCGVGFFGYCNQYIKAPPPDCVTE